MRPTAVDVFVFKKSVKISSLCLFSSLWENDCVCGQGFVVSLFKDHFIMVNAK